jgi:hypothetical protein
MRVRLWLRSSIYFLVSDHIVILAGCGRVTTQETEKVSLRFLPQPSVNRE